jgi:anthranilate synthase component I
VTAFSPSFEDFTRSYETGAALVWTRRVSDLDTPVSTLLKLGADAPGCFVLESAREADNWRARYSILGLKPDLVWRVKDGRAQTSRGGFDDADFRPERDAPLASLRKLIKRSALTVPEGLPPMVAGLFGYLGYDMVRQVERLTEIAPDPLGTPDALLLRPTVVAVFDSATSEIILATPVRASRAREARRAYDNACSRLERAARALDRSLTLRAPAREPEAPAAKPASNTTPEHYRAMVERCREYARAGDIFQAVPSQRFSAPLNATPFAFYRALRHINPSPFLFYFNFADFSVVGASPEILVRLRGDTVTVRPIAGTRPRGATPAEDAALEQELLADPKERAEHLMLLDLGRNDVGRVARRGAPAGSNAAAASAGSAHVRVVDNFKVWRFSSVMHIISTVEGDLAPGLDAVDALMAGFPAGTVSGAPKVRAMQIINELEPHKRGVYAGGVGYFSAGGDMDTCIALRTGVIKDGRLYVQAGGGVVLDSDAQTELEETEHKARALFRAAAQAWRFS